MSHSGVHRPPLGGAARPPRFGQERGQALVEFIILFAALLLPLLVLMPMVAKYQDVQHTTQLASRYLAFDATSQSADPAQWKTPDRLSDEVRARFYGNPGADIASDKIVILANGQPFWTDPTGAGLVPNPSASVRVTTGQDGSGFGVADGFNKATDGDAFAESQGGYNVQSMLGLPARGVYTANVAVSLADLPSEVQGWFGGTYEPLDRIGLRVQARSSTVTASWVSSGPDDTINRLTNPQMVPTLPLKDVMEGVDQQFVSVIEAPGQITGPRIGKLDFWRDVVPTDRLR